MIHCTVNGKQLTLSESISVFRFLEEKKLHPGSVLVEYNKEFLQKNLYKNTLIQDGDTIEIIRAFGGG